MKAKTQEGDYRSSRHVTLDISQHFRGVKRFTSLQDESSPVYTNPCLFPQTQEQYFKISYGGRVH